MELSLDQLSVVFSELQHGYFARMGFPLSHLSAVTTDAALVAELSGNRHFSCETWERPIDFYSSSGSVRFAPTRRTCENFAQHLKHQFSCLGYSWKPCNFLWDRDNPCTHESYAAVTGVIWRTGSPRALSEELLKAIPMCSSHHQMAALA